MRMRRIALALVASLLLAALCSGVSAADTSGDLKAAKDELDNDVFLRGQGGRRNGAAKRVR